MPAPVRILLLAGATILVLALLGLMLAALGGAFGKTTPDEWAEMRVPILTLVGFCSAGLAISLGALRSHEWAYRALVVSLFAIVLPTSWFAIALTPDWKTTLIAVGICGALTYLIAQLRSSSVRAHFGLAPLERNLLRLPAWLSLVSAALNLIVFYSPQPGALFSLQLSAWQVVLIGVVFSGAYLAQGIGLLRDERWLWPLALTVSAASFSVGLGYLTNATTDLFRAIKFQTLGNLWSAWVLWRIWLHQRGVRKNLLF